MAESREEELTKAMGWAFTEEELKNKEFCEGWKERYKIYFSSPDNSLLRQDKIRQRVRELLDELGFDIEHKRLHKDELNKGLNYFKIIGLPVNYSDNKSTFIGGWFPDCELPEKERDLLIWLAERKGEK